MKRKHRKLSLQKETLRTELRRAAGGDTAAECATAITICTCGYSCGDTCLGTCETCLTCPPLCYLSAGVTCPYEF